MKKKYTIALLILILVFSCGKKDKKTQNSQSKSKIENIQDDKLKELTKKAEKGDVSAQTELGEMYLHGNEVKADYKKSMEWSKKAAEKGSYRAMTNIGILYFDGLGVEKDYKKAFDSFSKATDGGDTKGPRYLGIMSEKGLGVKKSLDDAAFYYEIGDSSGDLTSRYNLGKIHEKVGDYARSIELYKKTDGRMDKITAPMYEALGDLYAAGKGVEKNTKEAKEWYEKAVKSGNQEAQEKIAKLK